MPSVATAVVVNDSADSINVVLNARFVLVVGSPSDTVYVLRGRVPDGIDVVLHSDLVITVSGTMDRAEVDGRAIQNSAIARHLQNYFHVNGEQLGVRIASKIYVDDDDDGKVKLTLSPTRPVLERCSRFLRLSVIELVYACKTPRTHASPQPESVGVQANHLAEASPAADPFSPHGFLPLVAALDRTVDKFAALHLVRKFPLIFGPWRERFDAEVRVSRNVARAITDIVARSPHTAFRKRCHRLIKAMRKNAVRTSHASADSLRALLSAAIGEEDKDELDDLADAYTFSDNCDVLQQGMERLLQCGVKSKLYKSAASAGVGQGSAKSLDDDFQLSGSLTTSPMTLGPIRDDHDQNARDRVDLRFDEDADTMGGSQDPDDLFGVDTELDDFDLWVSDEAESVRAISPQLQDIDDSWGSSQSTLDVCVLSSWTDSLIIESDYRTPSWTGKTTLCFLHSPLARTPRSPTLPRVLWATIFLTMKKTTGSTISLSLRLKSVILLARHPMLSRKPPARPIPRRTLIKVSSSPLQPWT
ncbi:hypothetical protein OH76DRAFT_1215253 [Lentinus brumalis]|uniref:Uncharacterized protein n=1 Tax=Lentinus brumalis TaxID=2498619 RepID=A0A371DLF7_9APHY|nr:hypothetical protein OH76DRAFT_1215253 [Polyporus brumalis]